jgi:hypothetical protein
MEADPLSMNAGVMNPVPRWRTAPYKIRRVASIEISFICACALPSQFRLDDPSDRSSCQQWTPVKNQVVVVMHRS